MLVLTRKVGEKIVIGNQITVTVVRLAGNRVTLGIEAPLEMRIVRSELLPIVNAFREERECDLVEDVDRELAVAAGA